MTEKPVIPNEFEPKTLLYVGLRESNEGKLFHAYIEVPDDVNEYSKSLDELYPDGWKSEELMYSKPHLTYIQPGILLAVQMDEEKSIHSDLRIVIGPWHDDQDRLDWQTQSRVIKTKRAKEREAKKITSENLIYAHLDPIKESYKKLSVARKRAFLAYIIEYLTR